MDKCIVFLSRYEEYFESAKKIKSESAFKIEIEYIEDFMCMNTNVETLDNSIIYFLCNSKLNAELVYLLKNTKCYIFNKRFFEHNYNKLEMQKILNNNNINIPKIFDTESLKNIKLPIFCKENKHAGMVLKAYTRTTIDKFFEIFERKNFILRKV